MLLKRSFRLFVCLALCSLAGQAQVQYVTINPAVDEVHDTDVSIQRVEITAGYTVLYMSFAHKTTRKIPGRPNRMPSPFDESIDMKSTIQFEPTAMLFANRGDVSYKFIRAENIPTRDRLDVTSGKRVDFVAYFERLDPGVQVFDLFECNDRNNNICFNFYGVHVTNPAKKLKKTAPVSPQTPVAVKPTSPPPTRPNAPPTAKPGPAAALPGTTAVAIRGTTRDAKTNRPVGAVQIYLRALGKTADTLKNVSSDAQTGDFKVAVKPIATYALTVKAKGYFTRADTLTTGRTDLLRDLTLTPIETGAKLTLQNIEFDAGKFDLRPQSYPELNRLVQLMRENPALKIRLEGHTDVLGDFDANLDLSRNRVKEVKAYLVKQGIDTDRIDTIGYGASRPLTKKSAGQNRRVELVITES